MRAGCANACMHAECRMHACLIGASFTPSRGATASLIWQAEISRRTGRPVVLDDTKRTAAILRTAEAIHRCDGLVVLLTKKIILEPATIHALWAATAGGKPIVLLDLCRGYDGAESMALLERLEEAMVELAPGAIVELAARCAPFIGLHACMRGCHEACFVLLLQRTCRRLDHVTGANAHPPFLNWQAGRRRDGRPDGDAPRRPS